MSRLDKWGAMRDDSIVYKGPSIYYVIQIWGPERPPPPPCNIVKMAIYCPQGSGTLRQQLLMMH